MNDELQMMVEREVLGSAAARRREGAARARVGFGFHHLPSTGSAVDRSGTSMTPAWRSSRSRGRSTTSRSPMVGRSRTGLDPRAS